MCIYICTYIYTYHAWSIWDPVRVNRLLFKSDTPTVAASFFSMFSDANSSFRDGFRCRPLLTWKLQETARVDESTDCCSNKRSEIFFSVLAFVLEQPQTIVFKFIL